MSAPSSSRNQRPRSSTTGRSSDCGARAATATGSRICLCRRNTPSRATTRPSGASSASYRFTSGMIYAMGFSNVSLGIARGALEAFIELARDKIPRGARKTLRENNVIQSEVAQCEAKLRSSRASIHATLEDMWEDAERDGDFAPERHWQLRLAATWAIQQARDVVASVYNVAGSNAVFNENPFERRLRDIHAGTQQGQGRPIHFETVGQILLGLPPEGRMFR